MVRIILLSLLICIPINLNSQQSIKIQYFQPGETELLPGIFKDAELTDIQYILAMDPDKLLAPFLREAGLTPKKSSYTNWENTGLDGHIGGHYLSALALITASGANPEAKSRLHYMLKELKRCQDQNKNGYLGGVPGSKALWQEVFTGKVEAIKNNWVPLYNLHKIFAGLRDAYTLTNNPLAREMLFKLGDWFVNLGNALTEDQMQQMLNTEHGGINEVLADLTALSHDQKYLTAARKFSHQLILNPLSQGKDQLTNLHANTQIPKVIGFERIAQTGGDVNYHQAAVFFWQTVVRNRSCSIGGNSVREHFNPANDFSTMITSEQGPETCNTYNMLKLTRLLFQDDGNEQYIAYYERALYNHILSSKHPGKGGFVYFTPIRPGHYRVYSQPQTSMWCCVGSGMENHVKYNEMIYAHDQTDLYINLFIASKLNWKEIGFRLRQETTFPEEEKTTLIVEKASPAKIKLKIRYPQWVKKKDLNIRINDQTIKISEEPGNYIILDRQWSKNDKIEIKLPMHISTETLPDGSPYVAFLEGPIVLAAKTDTTDLKGLFADDSRMGHVAQGKLIPLQKIPSLVGDDPDLTKWIKRNPDKELIFTLSNLKKEGTPTQMQLIPFYKLHDSRYILYWPKFSTASYDTLQSKIRLEENEKEALNERTVDLIYPGEQQPESDHFMKEKDSYTGISQDRHFRESTDYISYQLRNEGSTPKAIRIILDAGDPDVGLKISINGEDIGEIKSQLQQGNTFYTCDLTIPDQILKKAGPELDLKLYTHSSKKTGKIVEIRLLKQ